MEIKLKRRNKRIAFWSILGFYTAGNVFRLIYARNIWDSIDIIVFYFLFLFAIIMVFKYVIKEKVG